MTEQKADRGGAGTAGNAALARAYQPIIRGYFAVAALYYAIMALADVLMMSGNALLAMTSASFVAAVATLAAAFELRRPMSQKNLERMAGIVSLLVIGNVLVALRIEYNEAKLGYFMMMAMIFAFASVSVRQAVLSVALTLGALWFELYQHANDQLSVYGFVSFAAGISAISISYFLRRSIEFAIAARKDAEDARREAECARTDAEDRLVEAQRIGESMRRRSLSDSLTGLPNRRAFFEALAPAKRRVETGQATWLVLLDLDGFKHVNDNYGHLIGDALLKAVAGRLRDHCGKDAHVSRMGGDEFNLILSGIHDEESVEQWCQDLLTLLAGVYLIEDRLIRISGSIGCYRVAAGETDSKLIQSADYALLHAKRHGKNRVVLFREDHARDSAERYEIEHALRSADLASEIELLFQPQFDLGQGRVVGAEALARWRSPSLGPVKPDRFIRVAEESGLIAKITLVVLGKAIDALESWSQPVPVSINLSGNDLMSDQIIDQIIARVAESRLPHELIEFEVTETAMMPDARKASANLLRLSDLGHPIALDDFGTGYSNFTYLRSLPIGKLKVDRSFMESVTDPMTEKVLHSLVGMARTLNVHCLLEGVENELELVMAKRVGAQSVQGYLFGVPMTLNELRDHVAERQGPPIALAG